MSRLQRGSICLTLSFFAMGCDAFVQDRPEKKQAEIVNGDEADKNQGEVTDGLEITEKAEVKPNDTDKVKEDSTSPVADGNPNNDLLVNEGESNEGKLTPGADENSDAELGSEQPSHDQEDNKDNFQPEDETVLSFLDYCLNQDLDPIATTTIEELMNLVQSDDCHDAYEKLLQLKEISFSKTKQKILNLNPLAEFSNLRSLNLSNQSIVNLRPLSGLSQLKTLDLSHNHIQDLSSLSRLTELNSLDLSNNYILDISPLTHLKNLKALYLSANRIHDVSPFLDFSSELQNLNLDENPINKDTCPVARDRSHLLDRYCASLAESIATAEELLIMNKQIDPRIAELRNLGGEITYYVSKGMFFKGKELFENLELHAEETIEWVRSFNLSPRREQDQIARINALVEQSRNGLKIRHSSRHRIFYEFASLEIILLTADCDHPVRAAERDCEMLQHLMMFPLDRETVRTWSDEELAKFEKHLIEVRQGKSQIETAYRD